MSVVSVTLRTAYAAFSPKTNEEQLKVREHLEQILVSAVFRKSRRYASVLKYVVESTLDGNADQLKERTIGVEVFGRTPDYDTATDHVVRSAIAEIRKRLAQYYQEEGNTAEIRIELQPGSYVPQFQMALGSTAAPLDSLPSVALEDEPAFGFPDVAPAGRPSWTVRRWFVVLGVAAAALATYQIFARPTDPLDSFWRPVFSSARQVLVCIGNLDRARGGAAPEEVNSAEDPLTVRQFHRLPSQTVHLFDAMTMARFAGLLQTSGKLYRIESQTEATLTDLQNGPVVLIGLLNNDWTERLVGQLRFVVERPAPGQVTIRDRSNPSQNDWSMDYLTPLANVTRDYALVIRVLDPKTGQMVVTAGGISVFGTLAASEFLTNPNEIKKLDAVAPHGWEHKNVEIVLSTEVIRGRPGRPTIVATHFW